MSKWTGVDLDGTLAQSGGSWQGPGEIGKPIAAMVARVRKMLALRDTVKIFTARVASTRDAATVQIERAAIRAWTRQHLGQALEATAEKDFQMTHCFDDKAVSVQLNTGAILTQGWSGA